MVYCRPQLAERCAANDALVLISLNASADILGQSDQSSIVLLQRVCRMLLQSVSKNPRCVPCLSYLCTRSSCQQLATCARTSPSSQCPIIRPSRPRQHLAISRLPRILSISPPCTITDCEFTSDCRLCRSESTSIPTSSLGESSCLTGVLPTPRSTLMREEVALTITYSERAFRPALYWFYPDWKTRDQAPVKPSTALLESTCGKA